MGETIQFTYLGLDFEMDKDTAEALFDLYFQASHYYSVLASSHPDKQLAESLARAHALIVPDLKEVKHEAC